jgi:prepilin-type processing-associated H-X9-DG protein
MPQVFRDPAATPEEIAAGLTPYQMLRGEKTAFAKDAEGPRMDAITDGLSKTLGIVEVARDKVVPWTKPQDLPFDADKPFAGLGTDRRPGKMFGAAFLDGHVEMLSPDDVPPEAVKAMATANAGDRRDE